MSKTIVENWSTDALQTFLRLSGIDPHMMSVKTMKVKSSNYIERNPVNAIETIKYMEDSRILKGSSKGSIRMPEKELEEARMAGISPEIIYKMSEGMKLTEGEKEEVRENGKVYIPAYMKDGKWIKPQLRGLPGFRYRRTSREVYIPEIYPD